jgi:hypothetical protein
LIASAVSSISGIVESKKGEQLYQKAAPGAASFEDGRKRAPPFILLNKETNDGSL